jgi:curved DNA-binding protein CbpA
VNPYEILGVPAHATQAEIKAAYRSLVKRYHPDRNAGNESAQIQSINAAYEILSDPEKRRRYDNPFEFVVEVEDPRETYRREYLRKRAEREKQEREERRIRREGISKKMRMVNLIILLFAITVVLDSPLPPSAHHQQYIRIWQKGLDESYIDRQFTSYIETPEFTITVPNDVYEKMGKSQSRDVTIYTSPLYKSLKRARHEGSIWEFPDHFSTDGVPFHYCLLIVSFMSLFKTTDVDEAFAFSFFPAGLTLIVLLLLF